MKMSIQIKTATVLSRYTKKTQFPVLRNYKIKVSLNFIFVFFIETN